MGTGTWTMMVARTAGIVHKEKAMTREEISEKMLILVSEQMGVYREKVTEESAYMEDLGADSLDCVELIMEVEDQFDLSIPDEDAEKWVRVKDTIDYIEEKE